MKEFFLLLTVAEPRRSQKCILVLPNDPVFLYHQNCLVTTFRYYMSDFNSVKSLNLPNKSWFLVLLQFSLYEQPAEEWSWQRTTVLIIMYSELCDMGQSAHPISTGSCRTTHPSKIQFLLITVPEYQHLIWIFIMESSYVARLII